MRKRSLSFNSGVLLVALSNNDKGMTTSEFESLMSIDSARWALRKLSDCGLVAQIGKSKSKRGYLQTAWVATEKGMRQAIQMEKQLNTMEVMIFNAAGEIQ